MRYNINIKIRCTKLEQDKEKENCKKAELITKKNSRKKKTCFL